MFGTRYAGKTCQGLEVGREGVKKTKESPPRVELKPMVMLNLAQFLHCTELGGRNPSSLQSYEQCPMEMGRYHFIWSFCSNVPLCSELLFLFSILKLLVVSRGQYIKQS